MFSVPVLRNTFHRPITPCSLTPTGRVVIISGRERHCLGSQGHTRTHTHTHLVKVSQIQKLLGGADRSTEQKQEQCALARILLFVLVCFWPFPFTSFLPHTAESHQSFRENRNSGYSTACLCSDFHHMLRDTHSFQAFLSKGQFYTRVLLGLEPESGAVRAQLHWEGERQILGLPEPHLCLL